MKNSTKPTILTCTLTPHATVIFGAGVPGGGVGQRWRDADVKKIAIVQGRTATASPTSIHTLLIYRYFCWPTVIYATFILLDLLNFLY